MLTPIVAICSTLACCGHDAHAELAASYLPASLPAACGVSTPSSPLQVEIRINPATIGVTPEVPERFGELAPWDHPNTARGGEVTDTGPRGTVSSGRNLR